MSHEIIAIGIDGSEGSHRALRWGLREARLRDCAVEAVIAYPAHDAAADHSSPQGTDAHQRADEVLRHVVSTVIRDFADPPAISCEVVRGDPIDVLLQVSGRVDLLVVGSHGISGLRHSALGSVSEACALLADCPSVVVPAATRSGHRNELASVAQTTSA
ncbi:MAG: hypothetical protein QOI51_575 [Nocardioidaceae bacterium]|jgi:nucleotide-binding universal stress UspA family protein|nr:hypothetical protein [Nocardioidaceae bacterium]